MATIEVRAPNVGYTGLSAGVAFAEGVAQVDPANRAALSYFRNAGYVVDGVDYAPVEPIETVLTPGMSANPDGIIRQPWSNDAAIMANAGGPDSDAFMPPTNAGLADPHGPLVVSPGLHAVPPAPIVPGPVGGDGITGNQEQRETLVASAVLVDRQLVPDVMDAVAQSYIGGGDGALVDTIDDPSSISAAVKADRAAPAGPLGLSDPASVREGVAAAAGELTETAQAVPAKSALVADWRDFAVARGLSPEAAADLTKAELVDRYGG